MSIARGAINVVEGVNMNDFAVNLVFIGVFIYFVYEPIFVGVVVGALLGGKLGSDWSGLIGTVIGIVVGGSLGLLVGGIWYAVRKDVAFWAIKKFGDEDQRRKFLPPEHW